MSTRQPVVEVMDPMMVQVMRDKTPAERLAIAFRMWESARVMIRAAVRQQHPEWPDDEINHELARRMSHRAVGTPANASCRSEDSGSLPLVATPRKQVDDIGG